MTLHTFNGEQMTTAQIHALVPCIRPDAIRKHLSEGRNTTQAMLCYVPKKPKPSKASQLCIGPVPGYARAAPSKMR